jgi:hypothetical protein
MRQLLDAFALLNLAPPPHLSDATLAEAWEWAIVAWNIKELPRRLAVPVNP